MRPILQIAFLHRFIDETFHPTFLFFPKFIGSGINEYVAKQFDQSIAWDDVKWLMG